MHQNPQEKHCHSHLLSSSRTHCRIEALDMTSGTVVARGRTLLFRHQPCRKMCWPLLHHNTILSIQTRCIVWMTRLKDLHSLFEISETCQELFVLLFEPIVFSLSFLHGFFLSLARLFSGCSVGEFTFL